MARGGPHLSFFDEIDKLSKQKHRCNICDEDIRGEDGDTFQKISKLLHRENWIQFLIDSKANGNAYYLSYLKKRNEGGKNEPSNIQVVCPDCALLTKPVSVRLPKKLIERMDDVIEYENCNREQRYGRSNFLADTIEVMVLLDEFIRSGESSAKLMSASDHTIVIRPVKKKGGKHEGKWQLVISGPKVEESGKKTKTLYSNPDLTEAKQKVAKYIECYVEEVRRIDEPAGLSDNISEYAKLSVLEKKTRLFRQNFESPNKVSDDNNDILPLFELVEKIESYSKDISDIQFKLEEISERSLSISESVRNLMSALFMQRSAN